MRLRFHSNSNLCRVARVLIASAVSSSFPRKLFYEKCFEITLSSEEFKISLIPLDLN